MFRRGATTIWEQFSPSWPEDMRAALDNVAYRSLCHGWASGPTPFLSEQVLGVKPTSPGFATVDIHPDLSDLKWAEGSVPTPNGIIHVRVDRTAEGTTAAVTLPAGIVANVKLGDQSLTASTAGT